MTSYELRCEIFKQAVSLAEIEHQSKYAAVAMWNDNPKNSVMKDYPEFPSYEYIEQLAEKINTFVSSK